MKSASMSEGRFRDLLLELIDENPFAIRAVLKILDVAFTTSVPTLAVTCEEQPRLLVNLDFVRKHCLTDDHVKAVVCHEFLHVLLRHTEDPVGPTPARHLGMDAVINAIIHREFGARYSGMMANYYGEAKDLRKLLRPMNSVESDAYARNFRNMAVWVNAWSNLYAGRLVVDDIDALASQIEQQGGRRGKVVGDKPFILDTRKGRGTIIDDLLGDHAGLSKPLPGSLREALDDCMRQMDGTGIWRSPKDHGIGTNPYQALFAAADSPLRHWEQKTMDILRRHSLPDPHSRATRNEHMDYRIPVLSPRDRRAFLQALWNPFLPDATWSGNVFRREGTTQVYLDVSGSMSAEMPLIVALLGRLGRYIRRPFWAFSDVVAPAVIERGQLKAETTGGTSMACVLDHVARTQPDAAIVVTDGYIERLEPAVVKKTARTRLHVLVTRDGNPAELRKAGLPYTQLDRLPT